MIGRYVARIRVRSTVTEVIMWQEEGRRGVCVCDGCTSLW